MKILIKIIDSIIEFIERIEYRGLELDQSDIDKKILKTYSVNDIEVLTDTGFKNVSQFYVTQPYDIWRIDLDNGLYLECADNHRVFLAGMREVFVKDLGIADEIMTMYGPAKVINISKTDIKLSMSDLTIADNNHRYWTGGILSHNTVSAAIAILHYIIFNNDKTVMIVANKSSTVIEIVDKIKGIYMQLPFFIKPGVINWNQRSIVFETCRLKTEARTKEPAIGFTIDFLYLDEFAHIPRNIIEPYYKAVYPTVAAVNNSKIIITSTPNGFNLFHKLLIGSEAPVGSKIKNSFKSMRVYWWQVPARNVTYIKLNQALMDNYGINENIVLSECYDKGWDSNLHWDYENNRWVITVNNINCTPEEVRAIRPFDININEMSEISTWKEDAIRDIGSEEAFNQEFGLQFIAGSKLLFNEEFLKTMAERAQDYRWVDFPQLSRCRKEVNELIWTEDEQLFVPSQIKNYSCVVSIDCSEGLGQDYSVINIFRCVRVDDLTEVRKSLHEFFRLEQIGIYRSNTTSISELAEILYVILFEILNPERTRAVLEYNTYGGELLAKMPHIFDGVNDYGTYIWQKYKHRVDAERPKIGLKVTSDKRIMVEDYIKRMKNRQIVVTERNNVVEISTFVKDVTPHGNIKFEAESGNDDAAMTVVDICTIFETTQWKDMCEVVYEDLSIQEQIQIDTALGLYEGPQIDYNGLLSARRRAGL